MRNFCHVCGFFARVPFILSALNEWKMLLVTLFWFFFFTIYGKRYGWVMHTLIWRCSCVCMRFCHVVGSVATKIFDAIANTNEGGKTSEFVQATKINGDKYTMRDPRTKPNVRVYYSRLFFFIIVTSILFPLNSLSSNWMCFSIVILFAFIIPLTSNT